MISLMTDLIEFDKLSNVQKAIVHKYFEVFKSFYYDKNCIYADLVSKLIDDEKILKVHDNGEKLKDFMETAIMSNRIPVIILTHQFVSGALHIPRFDDEINREFPYNFSVFLDSYGIWLLKNLIQNKTRKYYLRRLYRSIPTWDDVLRRININILQDSPSGIIALDNFYKEMLLSPDFPVIWFFPEGTSRGFDRGIGFKKGIFYLLKKIEADRKLLDKFSCENIAVCFVDQYNVEVTDKALEYKVNLLHQFSQMEINKCVADFSFGSNFLAALIYKYRQKKSEIYD